MNGLSPANGGDGGESIANLLFGKLPRRSDVVHFVLLENNDFFSFALSAFMTSFMIGRVDNGLSGGIVFLLRASVDEFLELIFPHFASRESAVDGAGGAMRLEEG